MFHLFSLFFILIKGVLCPVKQLDHFWETLGGRAPDGHLQTVTTPDGV